jgi:putative oxidoreductase
MRTVRELSTARPETSMAIPYAQHNTALVNASTSRDVAALIARVLLAAIFLLSGFSKIGGFAGTASYIASHGLPFPELGVVLAIVVEVGCGLLVLIGWKARGAALVLAIYTVVAGILFHPYWAAADAAARMGNYINFWKNVSIAGGFLMVFAFGPGRYSVRRSRRS